MLEVSLMVVCMKLVLRSLLWGRSVILVILLNIS